MHTEKFNFTSKLWKWSDKSSWYFISVPSKITDDINGMFGSLKRGWGSLPVETIINKTTWKTSVFYSKKTNSFLLPIKRVVRKKESLVEEELVNVTIIITD